eukprot:3828042-Pyramimonas_sp.AAC.1
MVVIGAQFDDVSCLVLPEPAVHLMLQGQWRDLVVLRRWHVSRSTCIIKDWPDDRWARSATNDQLRGLHVQPQPLSAPDLAPIMLETLAMR